MLIYALNGLQDQGWLVRQHVKVTGNVVLRGCLDPDGNLQLLEGSHRIAYAIELGVPVTIVLFGLEEHSNIRVLHPDPKTGAAVHRRFVNTANNPWAAFPERTWQYPWGHCCHVEGKRVLVLGDAGCKQAAVLNGIILCLGVP